MSHTRGLAAAVSVSALSAGFAVALTAAWSTGGAVAAPATLSAASQSAAADCQTQATEQAWPYNIGQTCGTGANIRRVRVLSTDRGAPTMLVTTLPVIEAKPIEAKPIATASHGIVEPKTASPEATLTLSSLTARTSEQPFQSAMRADFDSYADQSFGAYAPAQTLMRTAMIANSINADIAAAQQVAQANALKAKEAEAKQAHLEQVRIKQARVASAKAAAERKRQLADNAAVEAASRDIPDQLRPRVERIGFRTLAFGPFVSNDGL